MKNKFTYESDTLGYMIRCNGAPIGGARSQGTATHTSRGSRRAWQSVRADIAMHAQTARTLCAQLASGAGPAYLRKNIPA